MARTKSSQTPHVNSRIARRDDTRVRAYLSQHSQKHGASSSLSTWAPALRSFNPTPTINVVCFHSSGCAEDMYTGTGTGHRRAPNPLMVRTQSQLHSPPLTASGVVRRPRCPSHRLAAPWPSAATLRPPPPLHASPRTADAQRNAQRAEPRCTPLCRACRVETLIQVFHHCTGCGAQYGLLGCVRAAARRPL